MKERLLQLIDAEQLTSSKFADTIGVQRSSISHLLSGRNKPSYDFLTKTIAAFPYISAEWLLTGEGGMYKDDTAPGALFTSSGETEEALEKIVNTEFVAEKSSNPVEQSKTNTPEQIESHSIVADFKGISDTSSKNRKLTKVILLYDDNSFDSYFPQGG